MAGWPGGALLIAVVLTLAPTSAAAAPGPGAHADTVRVLQLNLCNSGDAACYTGHAVAEAAAVIRAEAPDVVTLNEVCADDVPLLARALAGRAADAPSAFRAAGDRRTGAAVRCRTGSPYGIAVLARPDPGAPPSDPGATGGVYPVQDTRSPEQRVWLCLPAAPRGAPVVACTTHLAAGNPLVAVGQCAYLLGTAVPAVRAGHGTEPLVLAGDLNLTAHGPDARSCLPAGDPGADDGVVQHVVGTAGLTLVAHRTVALRATDHPGLLVTLHRSTGAGGPLSR